MVKPGCFYTRFGEAWRVVKKCDRTKEYELRPVNQRKFSKARSFGFLSESLCLRGGMLQVWGGHLSREGLMSRFRGRSESLS